MIRCGPRHSVIPHILSFYRSCRNPEPGALHASLIQLLKLKGGNGEPGVSRLSLLCDQLIRRSLAGATDGPPTPQLVFRLRDAPSLASTVIRSICLRCLVVLMVFFSFVKHFTFKVSIDVKTSLNGKISGIEINK